MNDSAAPRLTLTPAEFAKDTDAAGRINEWLGSVDATTRVRWSLDNLPGTFAFFRVQKGKEKFVGEGQIVRHAEKRPGRIRPKQPVRRKIQIPYANAGAFDAEPKALVSDGILRRGMLDGSHVWPSLPGGAEEYQDARWQASALKVLPFHPP